jgi:DNA polymerase-3 subunit epsilon
MKGYVFLDVETANSKRWSICQCSFVVKNLSNEVVYTFNELVKPTKSEIEFTNTYIHGLSWSDVEQKRMFKDIWPEIKHYFNGDYLIVAHNAGFDTSCLKKIISEENLEWKPFEYLCTFQLLKKVHPDWPAHGLQDLSDRLNYSFNHHYALSDVNAMIHIFENEFTDLKDLRNKIIAVGYQTKVFLIE